MGSSLMEKRLLSVKELSEYLGIKAHTLYTWVSQKRIPYVKCGRLTKFDIKAIDNWIDRNKMA
jgi:excisionase family DNA binding protein